MLNIVWNWQLWNVGGDGTFIFQNWTNPILFSILSLHVGKNGVQSLDVYLTRTEASPPTRMMQPLMQLGPRILVQQIWSTTGVFYSYPDWLPYNKYWSDCTVLQRYPRDNMTYSVLHCFSLCSILSASMFRLPKWSIFQLLDVACVFMLFHWAIFWKTHLAIDSLD